MSINKEFEDRVMLTKEQYDFLLPLFTNEEIFTQTNKYYDTAEFKLLNSHQVLRIRTLDNGKKELTLKTKCNGYDKEINEDFSNEDLMSFDTEKRIKSEEIILCLKQANIDPQELSLKGSLTTKRIEKDFGDYLLVLDKNIYEDIVDYDIEIESSSRKKAHEIILKYCQMCNINYSPNYLSKSRRAILAHSKVN